jgi:hypothetical protein
MTTISKLTIPALAAMAFAVPALAEDPAPTATETPTAQEQCRTERDQMGKATFAQTYGTNKNKSNAFGKCVSKRDAATEEAAADAKTNASKECKAEAASDQATFDAKYKSHGKCVSEKAKAQTTETVEEQVEADVSAAKTCKAERKADPAAFKAKYGTNKNKSNAFGKCVSAIAKAQQDDEPTQS